MSVKSEIANDAATTAPASSTASATTAATTAIGERPKAVIKNYDMGDEMQTDVVALAYEALEQHQIEKDIAAFVKKELDRRFQPTWHVVVGKNFGSYVTHETKHFIYFYIQSLAFLIWKS